MTLFGASVVFAGIAANDPVITVIGLVLIFVGLGLFIVRQLGPHLDEAETGLKAGVVSIQAPAALVAVVIGVLVVMVGRGALTIGVDQTPDDSEAVLEPTVVVTTTVPETTTTIRTEVGGVVTTPDPPVPSLPDGPKGELPHTGGELVVASWGLSLLAGGRWVTSSAGPPLGGRVGGHGRPRQP